VNRTPFAAATTRTRSFIRFIRTRGAGSRPSTQNGSDGANQSSFREQGIELAPQAVPW